MTARAAALLALGLWAIAPVRGAFATLMDAVALQGLDKVTARVSTFTAPLDQPVRFGPLTVTARACDRAAPDAPPEAVAFLEIVEDSAAGEPAPVFTGWMFASSPALSAMEHPVYDVWVLACGGAPLAP